MKISLKKSLLGLLLIIFIAGGIGGYLLMKKLEPKADYLQYCDRAKCIHEQFVEFEKDYLGLPSTDAMEGDDEMLGLDLSTANGYLAQLIIGSGMDSEEIFFLEGSSCCVGDAPDNIVAPAKETLRPGENGWAFFKGRELGSNPPQPLLVPGYNPATKKWDDLIWKSGVPVLFTDGSVVLYRAEEDGEEDGVVTTKDDLPFSIDDQDLVQPATK
jgi:hypothetical protein